MTLRDLLIIKYRDLLILIISQFLKIYLIVFKINSHLNELTFILISRLYYVSYIIIYIILYIILIEVDYLIYKNIVKLKRL